MAAKWSFEKSRSFTVPYEQLLQCCEQALSVMSPKITRLDESSGVIEAEKPVSWPFKSDQQISVTVRSDCKVTAIGRLDLNARMLTNLSAEDLITEKFFQTLQDMIRETTAMQPGSGSVNSK
jgi:hypothetical protein